MGMYEFSKDDAYRFASHVHAKTRERGDELEFQTCPYCHGMGRDNMYKFSINLNTGTFKCLRSSCGVSGNMIRLSKDFDFSLGTMYDEYYAPKKKYRKLTTPKKPIKPKDPAVKYLESRGISQKVAEIYQITCQTDHENILCMPFLDEKGEWQFIKYRKTDFDKTKDSNKEWCEKDCKPILYGMYQCNMANKTLTICEGQLDSLSCIEAGVENAVSVPTGANGFTWVPYCWDFVNSFEKIIIFGDHEKGHITLLDEFKKRFDVPIFHVREEDYLDCKDANDILRKYGKEQVRKCVENAVQDPFGYMDFVSDIDEVNPYEIEKLSTGIYNLDYPLFGGLPFPGLTVITGKRSEGKSTLASQILVNALDQGYSCLAYSGELSAWQFKAWLVRQIAGPSHSFEYKTKYGDNGYNITKPDMAKINEWIGERLILLNNAQIGTGDTIGILDALENIIKMFGVRVVLLDNMMTAISAMSEKSSDKYEQQSVFTKRLANMAMRYNVVIILVAHKRKNGYGGDEMDDVSGTSDITNLASVVISYGRDKELDESQRYLRLLKNRLFGKTNFEGWVMNYDVRSNRIYGDGDNVNKEYGWANGFVDAGDDSPFT